MLQIDLYNAIEDPRIDNFTCLLFRLMLKADLVNRYKLGKEYPLEVEMIKIYRGDCPYKDNEVDYAEIYKRACDVCKSS